VNKAQIVARKSITEERKGEIRKRGRERYGIKGATGELRYGTCPICLKENVKLVCDHDRETGEIRGWPCGGCNMVIGRLGDNLEGVMRVIEYLQKVRDSKEVPE